MSTAEYRAGHREVIAARQRAYRAAHLESARQYDRAYAEAHRAELREKQNARYDPAKKAAYRATRLEQEREHSRRKSARRRAATTCDHHSCLALGAARLAWATQPHACWMCGVPVWDGVNLHMDHVRPLSRGGAHCADNLRPSCSSCNHHKGARLEGEL